MSFWYLTRHCFRGMFDVGTSDGATGLRACSCYFLALGMGIDGMPEAGKNLHPLPPKGRMGQVGFAVLLCVLVAIEWAEELLWRIARIGCVVTESTNRHLSGMVAS
jgi:hypothetical protein